MEQLNEFINQFNKSKKIVFLGFLILLITFIPIIVLGENCVFPIHDQLDGSFYAYILNAKYFGQGTEIYPELLGGVSNSSMALGAPFFGFLYIVFLPLVGFVIQSILITEIAFVGMYYLLKEFKVGNLISLIVAVFFAMLPARPIYGLSILGVPIAILALIYLFKEKNKIISILMLIFFGMTSSLTCVGYAILLYGFVFGVVGLLKKKKCLWLLLGGVILLTTYIFVNYKLIMDIFIGTGGFVSHREEFVNHFIPFFETFSMSVTGELQHIPSQNKYFLPIIIIILIVYGVRIIKRKTNEEGKKRYYECLLLMLIIVITIGIGAFCQGEIITDWKNQQNGVLRYFQAGRVTWLLPTFWYLLLGISLEFAYQDIKRIKGFWKICIICLVLLPTVKIIAGNSYMYLNIYQIIHEKPTQHVTWKENYGIDIMEQIEKKIGKDKNTYKVGSLGVPPWLALYNGFYCIDGYSNNYSLEYKHKFRKIIEKEIDKSEETSIYFDEWGSRCYLFTAQTGIGYNVNKESQIVYKNLELDYEAMKELGCEYIFSAGIIEDAKEKNLEYLGMYDTEESYYQVFLYKIQ